jgi:putative heme-binding domain-containing protein
MNTKSLLPVLSVSILTLLCPAPLKAELTWATAPKGTERNSGTFSKDFELSGDVKSATLRAASGRSGNVSLNGELLGDLPGKFDLKSKLKPGKNTLTISASDNKNAPQIVAQIVVELANGSKQVLETGEGWTFAAAGKKTDEPTAAAIGAAYSAANDVLCLYPPTVTLPADITVPKDFKVELLYRVPKLEQGSWVSMTLDPKGRLICSDQYGDLYRVTPAPLGAANSEAATQVEALNTGIKGAHGLLYAFDSLYVMINEGPEKGLHRLTDTQKNGNFDKNEYLLPLEGAGEHGPHSLALSPDGKRIYFNCGNHTKPPANIDHVRGAQSWNEDHLLPRLWDANGHAKGILAPGGYVASVNPEGKDLEMFCYGYRNEFDFAFNLNGDIFTYDADMEWDIGTPWYRPTRINQSPSGGEFGWRSGAGKWPAYYADSLPATLDIGPGSPTGVTFGTGAKFPAKYQTAFFANDWTYGTMYAIMLKPDGAGYQAKKTEFVSGKPLSVSDVVIRPQDGALYFAVGGRRNQSALYRVIYTGAESTSAVQPDKLPKDAVLRRQLETLHVDGAGPESVSTAWPHLNHSDRFVRFAARVAVEKQPSALWAEKALSEKNPQAAIEALIALARVGDVSLQPKLISALSRLEYLKVDKTLRLPLLRAWQLAFIRMGKPAPEICAQVAKHFEPLFPQPNIFENNELLQLLVFLDSPQAPSKAIALLQTMGDDYDENTDGTLLDRNSGYATAFKAAGNSRPNKGQIALAYTLRNATAGWTPDLRKTFFSWFAKSTQWKGGNSFAKFLINMKNDALSNVGDAAEKGTLEELSKTAPAPLANLVLPKGPGRVYTIDEVVALAKDGLKNRNFEHGKAMYATTQCATCHHFANDGGNIGPDLTGSASRYSVRDLAESILDPSKVISDQYAFQEITLRDGSLVTGRILGEQNGKFQVMTNPFAPDVSAQVPVGDVVSRKDYGISPMPPGLINMLNPDELLDLIAYLFSGGDKNNKAFTSQN